MGVLVGMVAGQCGRWEEVGDAVHGGDLQSGRVLTAGAVGRSEVEVVAKERATSQKQKASIQSRWLLPWRAG